MVLLVAGCGDDDVAGVPPGATVGAGTVTAIDPRGRPDVGVVERVLDGDTVDVELASGVERIRLIGIDTPEPIGGNRPGECFGAEASDRTTALLPPGTLVRLERDEEARDQYGRLLAYVYRYEDDLFVNLDLVTDGYADTLTIEPNSTFADQFAIAADDARATNLGLWGACGGADTPAQSDR